MRVCLTKGDLKTEAGKQLLEMAIRIAIDGKIELAEVKELRRWLVKTREHSQIPAVGYLHEIMGRVTADGVVDRDEQMELLRAIERVIPTAHRGPVTEARKKVESERRAKDREARRLEQEKERAEKDRIIDERYAQAMRTRHRINKVAGVSFPNDDGTERQGIIKRCRVGERLSLVRDENNSFSPFAIQVMRTTGEQLGYVPDHLASDLCFELESGRKVWGAISDLTGGTPSKPTRGVNFHAFIFERDVPADEQYRYARSVLGFDVVEGTRRSWWRFWQ